MLPMRHMATLVVLGLVAACPAFARPLPKDAATDVKITLSPVIEKLLGDAATTPAQRRAIRLFHGQWDDLADLTLDEQARIAMWRFDLRHPSLTDEGANPLIRARAAAALGEPEAVLSILDGQISAATTIERARAMVDLGRRTDALILLRDLKERMRSEPPEDAAELTAGAEALAMLARLQGPPARLRHRGTASSGTEPVKGNRTPRPRVPSELPFDPILDFLPHGLFGLQVRVDAGLPLPPLTEHAFTLGVVSVDVLRRAVRLGLVPRPENPFTLGLCRSRKRLVAFTRRGSRAGDGPPVQQALQEGPLLCALNRR